MNPKFGRSAANLHLIREDRKREIYASLFLSVGSKTMLLFYELNFDILFSSTTNAMKTLTNAEN